MPLLVCQHCTKSYGTTIALADVNLIASAGEIVGLAGPNGAGKTTLLHSIVGIIRLDQGTIQINGLNRTSPSAKRLIGFMPDNLPRPELLTIEEMCRVNCTLFSQPFDREMIDELADVLEIRDRLREPLAGLSHGTCRKADLMAALATRPQILILDEPFSGLDPLMVDRVVMLIKAHADAGGLVLLSSHDLEITAECATRVLMIQSGEVQGEFAHSESQFTLRQAFRDMILAES
ncbi:MAG: ABC transporter ATP-binding protein [Propionibacteriaceae bacterium]|jgi:ABC-type multidrug transport system ATPase subunit|nr:ABC transporter ATP-binding protein [Propionibacteriaceae bacterium]